VSLLLQYALMFALILPAIILHEVSHGYVAFLLGDPTAKRAGRLTLNPLKHIDPFGTILLPALMILALGFGFGYAKPVPVNPHFFKDYRKGMFLTGFAGPATNVILALLASLAFRFVDPATTLGWLLYLFARANLYLVFFNLIPIPPLDGSRIIPLFLSDAAMQTYHQVERYGFAILMVVLWGIPALTNNAFDPISTYFAYTVDPILRLFTGVGG
jgi:Zn-dependent protease